MYPHSATLLTPHNPYTTPSLHHLLPTAYVPLATPLSHHLAQTPIHHTYPTPITPDSGPTPTLLQPTLPSTISTALRTLSHPQTHPTPSQPDPLLNPTHLPHHIHSTYYRTLQTLPPPTHICPPRRQHFHQS